MVKKQQQNQDTFFRKTILGYEVTTAMESYHMAEYFSVFGKNRFSRKRLVPSKTLIFLKITGFA